MTVRVSINGFGRIGRNVLRAIEESGRTDIEVVGINDLGDVDMNAYLLGRDSVHGRPHLRAPGHRPVRVPRRRPAEAVGPGGEPRQGPPGHADADPGTIRPDVERRPGRRVQ